MESKNEHAVSPVIAVILMVAVTVILSAAIGAFVFNIGQTTSGGQAQQELGISTTQSNGNYTIQVVTGSAEEMRVIVNGQIEKNLTTPTPGDTITVFTATGDSVTVVAVTDDGNSVVFSDTSDTSPSEPAGPMLASYQMDSGSGTTAVDDAHGNDGTIYNATWTENSHSGGHALDFDGNGDNIVISNAPEHDINSAFTISVWVKLDSPSGLNWIIDRRDASNYDGYFLAVHNNKTRFNLANTSGNDYNLWPSNTISKDKWTHIVAVWNESHMIVYENGEFVSMIDASITPYDTAGLDTYIGSQPDNSRFFKGTIDDVRIYDRALSDSEAEQLYYATK